MDILLGLYAIGALITAVNVGMVFANPDSYPDLMELRKEGVLVYNLITLAAVIGRSVTCPIAIVLLVVRFVNALRTGEVK